ncbi:MAG: peptide ligase PGM1-related protein [Natronosporangium sp.]
MSHGVGRWYSGVRGLWEVLAIAVQPDLALVMMQAPCVPSEVIDYLVGLRRPSTSARQDVYARLAMVELDDASARHLSEKFLTNPRALNRLRRTIERARAWGHQVEGLACYASSEPIARLADVLGLRLLETPPATLRLGGKAGSRELFRRAGVPHLPGTYRAVRSMDALADVLARLTARHGSGTWVVKVDQGFGSGHGNGTIVVRELDRTAIQTAIRTRLRPASAAISTATLLSRIASSGAVVERMAAAPAGMQLRFPSVSLYLPAVVGGTTAPHIIGTHEQIIDSHQSFVGATLPAGPAYRCALVRHAKRAAIELRRAGVCGHACIDFVAVGSGVDPTGWTLHALEVNLRQTGTTHANRAAMLLTGAVCRRGRLVTPSGAEICYLTTDGLIDDEYRSLTPGRLIAGLQAAPGLGFDPATGRGVVPHLWTTLTRFGKVGATMLDRSAEHCLDLQDRFKALLASLSTSGSEAAGR